MADGSSVAPKACGGWQGREGLSSSTAREDRRESCQLSAFSSQQKGNALSC